MGEVVPDSPVEDIDAELAKLRVPEAEPSSDEDVDVGEIRTGDSGERARGRGDAGERRVRRRRFRSARGEF